MKRTSRALWLSLLVACGHAGPRPSGTAEPEVDAPAVPTPEPAPEMIELRVLLIAYQGAQGAGPDQTRTKQDALARAQLMSEMARSGDPLAALIPTYSERAGAAGDAGVFKLQTAAPAPFDAQVIAAAVALPIGGISAPVETAEGYLVIERRPDPPVGPEHISARHILIAYAGSPQAVGNATRTEAEARARAEEVAAKAKAPGADWNALAAEYTDEPGSGETGGDLGNFGRGRMVPAFERAAFKLQVNEISDIVQSPFGFHVIQRYQ